MKNNLLNKILLAGGLFSAICSHAQSNNSAYAITDSVRNGVKWNYLRTLNLNNGNYSSILTRMLNNNELLPPDTTSILSCNGIAAIAHDKKNKRLYFTPMLTDRLGYVDLRTMKKYTVTNNFTGLMPKTNDQATIITRMVITEDDKGYALTNDGKHFIRFRTGNNPSVTNLGPLVDAPGNNESVHNGCSSYGGDIVADDDDHLYLFTSGHHIFKINIKTKVAKYIGRITGLPSSFTISGAVVDKSREKVIVVSSVDASDVFIVNMKTRDADRLYANASWRTADLANDLVLKSKKHSHHDHRTYEDMIVVNKQEGTGNIQLYPNPVTTKEFNLRFIDATPSTYTVSVMNGEGRSVLSKTVTAGGKSSIVSINLPAQISAGIYIVRVTDANNLAIYSGKVFVQL